MLKLPNKPLTNFELMNYVKELNIPNFRGVFMRNDLPKSKPYVNECGIINLDDKNSRGSHWTSYKIVDDDVFYFDSFGNIKPPKELFDYLKVDKIYYNYDKYQDFNTVICGHLCLDFLYNSL